jgi:hypothetical protein
VLALCFRIQCGWNNWRKISGVLCDRNVPVELKGKVYKSVVGPALTYGLQAAPLQKVEEWKFTVVQIFYNIILFVCYILLYH